MTNNNNASQKPTKTIWGASTSISFVRNFFDTKNQAINYALGDLKQINAYLPSIVHITRYDYYEKLGEFNDVVSVRGLKNWSNSIPYFQAFKGWNIIDANHAILTGLKATAYGMKLSNDRLNEAGVYYLDYISPYPVASSLFTYDGTPLDDVYKAFECPKVVESRQTEVRRYQDMPLEKVKEFKL